MGNQKRTVAVLLTAVLLIGQMGATAYAEEQPGLDTTGLCNHHTEHTACGYVEAVEGQPCVHDEHTPNRYKNELICGYHVNEGQPADNRWTSMSRMWTKR